MFIFRAIYALAAIISLTIPVQAQVPVTARSQKAIEATKPALTRQLQVSGFEMGAPMFMRIVKAPNYRSGPIRDGKLEIYLQKADGKFHLWSTLDVCAASGRLGPKTKQGDNQSPEGFYYITDKRFNPWSSYHLSLNLGYPNIYDRSHGYTGDFLMIHGQCVSIGCYAMTDDGINEIYTLAAAAISAGQKVIRVHSFPFPMTDDNLTAARADEHYPFWQNLKDGWDWFEANKIPPDVTVRDKRYVMGALPE